MTLPDPAVDLGRLARLLEQATPGEWTTTPTSSGGVLLHRGPGENAPRQERHPQGHLQIVPAHEGELIAALVNAAPALLRDSQKLAAIKQAHHNLREAELRIHGGLVRLMGRCATENNELMELLDALVEGREPKAALLDPQKD